jgi:ABC-2 type transport system ATP-binding protein
MPVLQVSELRKSYGPLAAVGSITFTIDAGEVFGLLGPNGAGKSTTINIIASLLPPDGGTVRVAGVGLSASGEYKRRIGYVPQSIALAEKLTAAENLSLIGRLYDLAGAELRRRVDGTLESVGLSERRRDLVATFSGGMKRRLNIAAALLHEPDLLLLDEPTAGVDPQARAYIFDIVERLAAQGRAVLYTTHYMEEAQRLCRRTAILDHGRILAMGTLSELTSRVAGRRALVLQAPGMTRESLDQLAARLGGAAWTQSGEVAEFTVPPARRSLAAAVQAAEEAGLALTSAGFREPDLEAVFLELTGRALRD